MLNLVSYFNLPQFLLNPLISFFGFAVFVFSLVLRSFPGVLHEGDQIEK